MNYDREVKTTAEKEYEAKMKLAHNMVIPPDATHNTREGIEGWERGFNPLEFQDFQDGRWYTNVEKLKAYIHQELQKARESERKRIVTVLKANVPLERIPSDVQKTSSLVDELMKLHYEPEHEEGQTCWCIPVTTVEPATKKAYIDHNEQRVVLRQFVEDNFLSKEESIASLCLGSNQARRGILNTIKEIDQSELDQRTEPEKCTCTYTPWGTRIVDVKCKSSIHKPTNITSE